MTFLVWRKWRNLSSLSLTESLVFFFLSLWLRVLIRQLIFHSGAIFSKFTLPFLQLTTSLLLVRYSSESPKMIPCQICLNYDALYYLFVFANSFHSRHFAFFETIMYFYYLSWLWLVASNPPRNAITSPSQRHDLSLKLVN